MGNLVGAEAQMQDQTTENTNNTNNNKKTNSNGSEEKELLSKLLTKSQQLIKNYNARTSGDSCSKLCVALDKTLNPNISLGNKSDVN